MRHLRVLGKFCKNIGSTRATKQCGVPSVVNTASSRIHVLRHHYSTTSDEIPQSHTGIDEAFSFLRTFFETQRHGVLSIASGCTQFCELYRSLAADDKLSLLCHLAENYGANQSSILHVASRILEMQSRDKSEAVLLRAEERLRSALTARYQTLFTDIGRIEGGVKFLVDMRADILELLSSVHDEVHRAHLVTLQHVLRDLLSLWFTVGFLQLERITWQSSCHMLQKISEYEAVHPVRHWLDLKRRVGPYRRCFVFTHASMPYEPLVVLHTALTDSISSDIQSITGGRNSAGANIDSSTPTEGHEDPERVTTAMFYSITSTQKGLQGVDLGNYLIKRVAGELRKEWPRLIQFSSISPIPGFRAWLLTEINRAVPSHAERSTTEIPVLLKDAEVTSLCQHAGRPQCQVQALDTLRDLVTDISWVNNPGTAAVLKPVLMRLCARYLYTEKRRGYALNSVANFHLQNGAMMWRLNWLADTSRRGTENSCCMMVNYRYFPEATITNSQRYIEQRHLHASPQIVELCS